MEELFDPVKLQARIPASGWPPGDCPEQHQFRHDPLPTPNDGATPALVLKAQEMLAKRR
jgi:hypothetical protein